MKETENSASWRSMSSSQHAALLPSLLLTLHVWTDAVGISRCSPNRTGTLSAVTHLVSLSNASGSQRVSCVNLVEQERLESLSSSQLPSSRVHLGDGFF